MRKAAVGSVILLASFLGGCGGGLAATGGARGERVTVASAAVSDDAFAGAVRDLLRTEPGSAERAARLTGVEQRQMARAASRFREHAPDRGLAAVTGALYLMRVGELRADTLGPSAHDALVPAAREVASHGDAGRARAFYEILLRLSPGPEQKDVQAHLDAIGAWLRDVVAHEGPVEAAGEHQRAAVSRALLEPSAAAAEEAKARTVVWIERALEAGRRSPPPSGEEREETFRALRTGPGTLMALHLRQADAGGALKDLERIDPSRARSQLEKVLKDAADDGDAEAWLDILRRLRVPAHGEEDDEEAAADTPEFLRAASFTVALEAFRLDPTAPEAAVSVAASLQDYGMAEASPAVLVDAAKAHGDPRTLGVVLGIVLHAMEVEVEAQDNAAARRAFKAAAPLLALAEAEPVAGKVTPSPSDLRAMMGEIELRDGHVDEAKKLLGSAVKGERAGAVYATLARIDRFEGRGADALGHLREALKAPDVARDPATHAEVLLTTSDVLREQGDAAGARAPLDAALRELAKARTQGNPFERARVERVLARVLDRFGAAPAASKALERAFDAAPHDKGQAAQTLGQMGARALEQNDVASAREALHRALVAELADEDLVYMALWQRLVEKRTKTPADGSAERVFASVADDGRWIGRLSAFGAGRIKAEALEASAKTPAQRTEALFYAAMDRRANGDVAGSEAGLKQALKAGGIDLLEVAIARDVLSGPRATLGGPLPEVGLP